VTKNLAQILTDLAGERAAFGKAFQERVIAYMMQEIAPFSTLHDLAVARQRALLNCKHYDEKMSSIGGATTAGGVRAPAEGDSSVAAGKAGVARMSRMSRNRDKTEKAHDESRNATEKLQEALQSYSAMRDRLVLTMASTALSLQQSHYHCVLSAMHSLQLRPNRGDSALAAAMPPQCAAAPEVSPGAQATVPLPSVTSRR